MIIPLEGLVWPERGYMISGYMDPTAAVFVPLDDPRPQRPPDAWYPIMPDMDAFQQIDNLWIAPPPLPTATPPKSGRGLFIRAFN